MRTLEKDTLSVIFDSMQDGILAADLDSRKFVLCNSYMCQMLGYGKEELLALGVDDIHPPAAIEHVRAEFERQMRGEITISRDLPVLRKDGSLFYSDVNAVPISLGGRKVMVGIFRDVTDRKRAEDGLRRQLALSQSLLQISSEGPELGCEEFLDAMLKEVGETIGADRVILYVSERGWKARALHLWSAGPKYASAASDVRLDDLGQFTEKLRDEGAVLIRAGQPGITPGLGKVLERSGAKSILLIALYFKGEVAGCMVVSDVRKKREPDEGEAVYLKSVSRIVSMCMENGMIQERMDERLVSADTVSRVAIRLMGEEPFQKKIGYAMTALASMLEGSSTCLYVRSKDGKTFDAQFSSQNHGREISALKGLRCEDFAAMVKKLENREMIIVPSLSEVKDEKVRSAIAAGGSRGGIVAPVFASGRLWGALGLGFSKDKQTWKEEHLSILATVAGMVGWLASKEAT